MNYTEFCEMWDNSNIHYFLLHTSGSTGEPKPIKLYKEGLIQSAKQTRYALSLNEEKVFCCIPTDKVGGFMMMVRAKLFNYDFKYIEPCSNPMLGLQIDHDFTFISLVPLQVQTILADSESVSKLNRFRSVLLGGGGINAELRREITKLKPTIYHTYGMTETYSHIALQRLNGTDLQSYFYPLSQVNISLNSEVCLQIKTPYTGLLQTHDLAKIYEDGSFEILGRSDFVINSGGIKISPEWVEKRIEELGLIAGPFVISSIPDKKLGEMLVLVLPFGKDLPSTVLKDLANYLPRYHAPKQIIKIKEIPMTETSKIKRSEIKDLLALMHNQ